MKRYYHPELPISVTVYDDSACIHFGDDLPADEVPCEGDVVRAGGRLWSVGEVNWRDQPVLHPITEIPQCIWWDADEIDGEHDAMLP